MTFANPHADVRIGLDVGGTKIDGIALAADGAVLARVRQGTARGASAVMAGVLDSIGALRSELDDPVIRSVGIGIPGLVDERRGRVVHAVNLGVESLDVAEQVQHALGLPCFVENDVNAAAVGAASLHAGSLHGDADSIAYLNLGTGVAAGIIVDGRIWRGVGGTAGEVGHLAVDPNGRLCGCGQRGCIETLCGGGALALAWGRGGELPVKDILDAADDDDPVALALRHDLIRGAAAAVRALVLAVDVESVIIGGGLTALADRIEPRIRETLRADAAESSFLRSLHLDERIEMLPAGSPVAAVGAALLGPVPTDTTALDKEILHHG